MRILKNNIQFKMKNKMKKLLTILGVTIFASVILTSYGRGLEEKNQKKEMPLKTKAEYQFILGKWNGTIRDKKLTIFIESIQGNNVVGYNIVGKNKRPLSGKISDDDREGDGECSGNLSVYKLVLNEPGDNKWDGKYTLYFGDCPEFDEQLDKILSHRYSVYGSWKAFSGKLSGDVYLTK